jgi:hypothetical protein
VRDLRTRPLDPLGQHTDAADRTTQPFYTRSRFGAIHIAHAGWFMLIPACGRLREHNPCSSGPGAKRDLSTGGGALEADCGSDAMRDCRVCCRVVCYLGVVDAAGAAAWSLQTTPSEGARQRFRFGLPATALTRRRQRWFLPAMRKPQPPRWPPILHDGFGRPPFHKSRARRVSPASRSSEGRRRPYRTAGASLGLRHLRVSERARIARRGNGDATHLVSRKAGRTHLFPALRTQQGTEPSAVQSAESGTIALISGSPIELASASATKRKFAAAGC